MTFEINKFMSDKYQAPTRDIKIRNKNLKAYFSNGSDVWKVRGLTAKELARTRAAAEKYQNRQDIITAITSGQKTERTKAWAEFLSIASETPEDFAKRVETLLIGSIDPELENKKTRVSEIEFVLKFSQYFPVEFYDITNQIYELTGIGGVVPGKSRPSGKTEKFEGA
jgi:hypothetical protein